MKLTSTRYVDKNGCRVSKQTPGARKVNERSTKYYGQYVDADSNRCRVPLSTDKTVARQQLAEIERQIELGKAGLVDPYGAQRKAPIASQIDAYEAHLRNKGVTSKHLAETMRRLRAVLEGCQVRSLADLRIEAVERFFSLLADRGTGATTRNSYRMSAKAFSRWCLMTRRMGEDALASLGPASGEIRRQRRAPTEDELSRLITTARERPLIEALTVRRGKNKGKPLASVRPEVQDELNRLGRERGLMYMTLVHTGLRRGELEALEVRHLNLSEDRPQLILPGSMTKNGKEARIPLRSDLAEALRIWLAETGKWGFDRVFRVPVQLIKILRRDLKMAGIPYRDDNGRTIDVHAFRHTTATYLAKNKVSPRVAQSFMRHSDIKLTLQTYTDLYALDEEEALAALPPLPRVMSPDETSPPTE
ncbi:tyrosine-type recombinase/integrase [Tautonia marina]|uniref:tyrosine-type recombinase/integrase n=1 Tax=Tautonia marina TaxID=2653855 RepID=UPI001375BC32|nr:site-specific integrase [Tautonia marina]